MDDARGRLAAAAVEAFADNGFHATTTRDIASRAGMSPAALYVHHRSKEGLLFALSRDGHLAALDVVTEAAARHDDPTARLQAMIHDFTQWHAEHSKTARIVQYELAALTPDHLAEVARHRRAIERTVREVLEEGVARGEFEVADVPGTALAMLSLAVDLVRWYEPGGSRSPQQLADLYAGLALRMARPL